MHITHTPSDRGVFHSLLPWLIRLAGSLAWIIPFNIFTGHTLIDWQWWVMLAGVLIHSVLFCKVTIDDLL